MTDQELADLAELRSLLDEAYDHYFALSDGFCKMGEGAITLHFGNYFERKEGKSTLSVSVYSYVFGPGRSHHFGSVSEALKAVKGWHDTEMQDDHAQDWW